MTQVHVGDPVHVKITETTGHGGHYRVSFAASMGKGATVLELDPSGKAALEIAALATEILARDWDAPR